MRSVVTAQRTVTSEMIQLQTTLDGGRSGRPKTQAILRRYDEAPTEGVSMSELEERPTSSYVGRLGLAFDRTVGNLVNGWITAALTASTGSPEYGTVSGALAGPVAEELSFGMRTLLRRQDERLSRMLEAAGEFVDEEPAELMSASLKTPNKAELLARASEAAARSTTDDKLDAISKLFAVGALCDDMAVVDDHIVALDALIALDAPHIRLLQVLVKPSPEWWSEQELRDGLRYAWPEDRIIRRDPGLSTTLPALLARLHAVGMIRSASESQQSARRLWVLTEFGRLCTATMLKRAVAGSPPETTWEN